MCVCVSFFLIHFVCSCLKAGRTVTDTVAGLEPQNTETGFPIKRSLIPIKEAAAPA